MSTVLAYSVAALLGVSAFALADTIIARGHPVAVVLYPHLAFAGTLSAATSAGLIRWLSPSFSLTSRAATGALRGALVVLVAHVLFGFLFVGAIAIIAADSFDITIRRTVSTVHEMVHASAFSAMFLPGTLLFGCITGTVLETRRSAVDA